MNSTVKSCWCLPALLAAMLAAGCGFNPTLPPHAVEYRSSAVCARDVEQCGWAELEQQAAFSAQVNCLLDGVTVVQSDETGLRTGSEGDVVVALAPLYGYAHVAAENETCPQGQLACAVASRVDRELTLATCGTQALGSERLRGGDSLGQADELGRSAMVTGKLAGAVNDFGLDGPDHFYSFTLSAKTRLETAVAANSTHNSRERGLRSPWQPALYLLAGDGNVLDEGGVLRAGVSYVFPAELAPGRYYLVVDSSQREFTRGDGMYRLYIGLDREQMGPAVPRPGG